MRMIKVILIYVFIALLPFLAQAQFATSIDNATVTITKYNGKGGAVIVPDTMNGLPVVGIGFGAFSGGYKVTSVTIPKTVTNIGTVAFSHCIKLSSINVDPLNSVYSSIDGVLLSKDQTSLIECPGGKTGAYTVPDSVKTIQDNAFADCVHITTITVPDHVVKIEWHAFMDCQELTNIMIGSGVSVIGDDETAWLPLSECSRLLTITVDPNNHSFSSSDGVLFDKRKNRLIRCPEGKTGCYTIPAGVLTIGNHSFFGVVNLSGIIIPNSVTEIEDNAFENCSHLTNVMISQWVKNIGNAAFDSFSSKTTVMVDPLNPIYSNANGVLIEKRKMKFEIPSVVIKEPADGASINAMWVDVHGTFKKNLKQIIIQNDVANMGIPATISGNTFEAKNVFLRPGTNIITAIATDVDGNTGTNSVTILGPADNKTAQTFPVQLQIVPGAGFVPLPVTFNLQLNVPGKIQKILYDFDGDGAYDLTCTDLKPVTHTYNTIGQFFPVITVQTSVGQFSSLSGMVATFIAVYGSGNALSSVNVQALPKVLSTIKIEDPVDIKWTASSNLYVLSRSTAAITEFDFAGNLIRSIKDIGSKPSGLDVDADGNVYVAITGDNQIKKFKPTIGSFDLDNSFGHGGSIGNKEGNFSSNELNAPFDVKLSNNGQTIMVSDSGNHRIRLFNISGQSRSPENNQFPVNIPRGLTCGEASSPYLFIADSGDNRIILADTISSSDLMPDGTSGTIGTALGQFNGTTHLAANKRGLYVADTGNNRVQIFNHVEGAEMHSPVPFIPRFSLSGELGLNHPQSVAAVDDFLEEKIYIADTGNNRVVLVSLPLDNPLNVWRHMIGRLKAGDVQGAISDFSIESKDKYQDAYQSLSKDDLLSAVKDMENIKPATIESDHAQYYFESTVDGKTLTFAVEFDKEFGQWKIVEY